jgi:hypothetical protein
MNEMSTKELAKLLAPFLAMTALAAFMAVVLFLRLAAPGVAGGAPAVASFDVVRYANAQRAVASAFLKSTADQTSANELLLNLSDRTRKTIAEVAGPNTLVVLKQSVVQGATRDITEEVLTKLGLPTNVPTADAVSYTLDAAPTMLMRPPAARKPAKLPGEGASRSGEVLP